MGTRPRAHRHARDRERGAVAVEFALLLPVLAMLLLGTVTAGLAYTQAIGLSNAVREGSRFAATTAYPPPAGVVWEDDVIARIRAAQFDDPLASTHICVWLVKQGMGALVTNVVTKCSPGSNPLAPGAPTQPAMPAGVEPGDCVVKVAASRNFSISAVLVNFADKTMTRRSVALYERATC